ncbi:MAG: D-hexose-6-phosphate mutarotase [Gemmatimonadaceae bacterium]|nr:D-hexose-6-phosphate mutarotase [Gemmatimonadaceae bacterium]
MSDDIPRLTLRAPDGASATVAIDGAHVVSWFPVSRRDDCLFVSERSTFGTGNAIRGGIPVIFPQFGPFGTLRQHGFARLHRWTVDTTAAGHAQLSLSDTDETRAVWPHRFQCVLTVDVEGDTLSVTLAVTNTDDVPFAFTAAFHPYFAVRNAFAARVIGLRGCEYRDSLRDGQRFPETDDVLPIVGPLDRIYYDAPDELTMTDGDRSIVVKKTNFPEAVVWNPGVEGTRTRADFVEGEEHRMLCVEAAHIQHPHTLAPGASWSGTMQMTATATA